MGFTVNRFESEVDPELLCSICMGVLEDPVELAPCEHTFCQPCIRNAFVNNGWTCPIDRRQIDNESAIGPVSRLLRNLLARLNIGCDFASYGCRKIVKLEHLPVHVASCENNPNLCEPCPRDCGICIPRSQIAEHNCLATLRDMVKEQQKQINAVVMEFNAQRLEVRTHRQEVASLKAIVAAWHARDVAASNTYNEVMRVQLGVWGRKLTLGRVTSWFTLLAVPPLIAQRMIRRTLSEAECPEMLLAPLADACVEWHWPQALRSTEARLNNLAQLTLLVCRRVPGKQAVIVLPTDNPHMGPEFLLDRGYVLIFESGIENFERPQVEN